MNKVENLRKQIDKATDTYMQSVIKILDENVPDLDGYYKQEIAKNICFDRQYMDPDEIILSYTQRVFEIPGMADLLTARIQYVRERNKYKTPNINKNYWCKTCGSHSHEQDPETGYCFHCHTDNWEPEKWREKV